MHYIKICLIAQIYIHSSLFLLWLSHWFYIENLAAYLFFYFVCVNIYTYMHASDRSTGLSTLIFYFRIFFSCASIAFALFISFCLYCFALQVCHKCVSFSTGVILPVHCVCGLHHAAVLYAGRHHRQCPDLRFSHHCIERLPVHHSWSHGTNSVAGKAIKHKCGLMVGDTLIYKSNESPKYTHTSVYSNCVLYYLISINLWLY